MRSIGYSSSFADAILKYIQIVQDKEHYPRLKKIVQDRGQKKREEKSKIVQEQGQKFYLHGIAN